MIHFSSEHNDSGKINQRLIQISPKTYKTVLLE